MKFCSLASGSSGNSQYIETDQARILVDGGLSGKAIEKNLEAIGVDPASLDAILVTHEHTDHVKGVGVLARRFDLEVFANENTWLAMEKTVKTIPKAQVFSQEEAFSYRDLDILPISTYHDCVRGTAYVLRQGARKISLLTDTGQVTKKILTAMAGSDLYYIEANHDRTMLAQGPYPRALKNRIASKWGHLSNDHTAEVLSRLLEKRQEHVVLGHLSRDNNLPRVATRTIREGLAKNKILEGIDFSLEVAKPLAASRCIEI
ncbi:MAG: MBL fold metallo-hydrolase [Tissierellia bacterium]|nr:MBL fold metallo-hydrolase [Tissierellia bacterium]